MRKSLVVVDVQRDFCVGGALPATDTESLLMPLQKLIEVAREKKVLVVFTQDWHSTDHTSFKKNGGLWPVHCIAGEKGSELMPQFKINPGDVIIHKGVTREAEGYSAFESTKLVDTLRLAGVRSVGVCGIATEYCVRATALDAARAQFKVDLLTDLIRPVDRATTDGVFEELARAGVHSIQSAAWLNS